MTKTTKQQFELFKSECEKWIKKLQIDDWRIEFFIDYEDDKNRCYIYRDIRTATVDVYFCAKSSLVGDTGKIQNTAKHEMIHVVLGRLKELCEKRYLRDEEIDEAEEALVRKLEKLIN